MVLQWNYFLFIQKGWNLTTALQKSAVTEVCVIYFKLSVLILFTEKKIYYGKTSSNAWNTFQIMQTYIPDHADVLLYPYFMCQSDHWRKLPYAHKVFILYKFSFFTVSSSKVISSTFPQMWSSAGDQNHWTKWSLKTVFLWWYAYIDSFALFLEAFHPLFPLISVFYSSFLLS